jgi:hypothetical protein
MHRILLFSFFLLVSSLVFCKDRIKSQIVDHKNQPIIGAVVVEEGTKNFAVTNSKGEFEISVMNNISKIKVSIFGFDPLQIPVYQIFPIIEMRKSDKYPILIPQEQHKTN